MNNGKLILMPKLNHLGEIIHILKQYGDALLWVRKCYIDKGAEDLA